MARRKTTGILAAVCLAAIAARGDKMTVGTHEHTGTFQGYEKGRFAFRRTDGKLLDESRGSVRRLTLTAPLAVTLYGSGRSDGMPARLVSYSGVAFTVERDGKQGRIFAAQLDRVAVNRPPEGGDGNEAQRELDVSPLLGRRDLTPRQSEALTRYRNARRRIDDFVAESSAMVARMDRATGRERERLLNELRLRKDAEQPLKRELDAAKAGILAAIPMPWTAPAAHQPEGPPEAGNPVGGEEEALLLDVSALESPFLRPAQTEALANYKAAKKGYMQALASSSDDAMNRAIAELNRAQEALLKVFPEVKIEP